jgi:predicted adenylyl cyclase CyaB
MPRNIEIKARVHNAERFQELVESISDSGPETIQQEDVVFRSPTGRLKLRKFVDGTAELIQYERPDTLSPTGSDYIKVEMGDPMGLQEALGRALGVRGVVRKERKLYRIDRTRIHLDRVEGLGDFMELEVMLEPGEASQPGTQVAEHLMARLGVSPSDLIEQAYIDLIERKVAVE